MITKEGSTKIFMTLVEGILMLGHGFLNQKVEMHYFFENLLYSWAWIRQTNYIVIMAKQSFIRILNFIILEAGVLKLGRSHISHIVNTCIYSMMGLLICK